MVLEVGWRQRSEMGPRSVPSGLINGRAARSYYVLEKSTMKNEDIVSFVKRLIDH